jgi:hypothetical protein
LSGDKTLLTEGRIFTQKPDLLPLHGKGIGECPQVRECGWLHGVGGRLNW